MLLHCWEVTWYWGRNNGLKTRIFSFIRQLKIKYLSLSLTFHFPSENWIMLRADWVIRFDSCLLFTRTRHAFGKYSAIFSQIFWLKKSGLKWKLVNIRSSKFTDTTNYNNNTSSRSHHHLHGNIQLWLAQQSYNNSQSV